MTKSTGGGHPRARCRRASPRPSPARHPSRPGLRLKSNVGDADVLVVVEPAADRRPAPGQRVGLGFDPEVGSRGNGLRTPGTTGENRDSQGRGQRSDRVEHSVGSPGRRSAAQNSSARCTSALRSPVVGHRLPVSPLIIARRARSARGSRARQPDREARAAAGRRSTVSVPPCATTIERAMARPSPAPPGVAGAGGVQPHEGLEDPRRRRPRRCRGRCPDTTTARPPSATTQLDPAARRACTSRRSRPGSGRPGAGRPRRPARPRARRDRLAPPRSGPGPAARRRRPPRGAAAPGRPARAWIRDRRSSARAAAGPRPGESAARPLPAPRRARARYSHGERRPAAPPRACP